MAYFNLLASVSEAEVENLRCDPLALLHPTLVSGASHLLSYWVEIEPLGGLLKRALDGGELIDDRLWHPLRPPLFHRPTIVRELADGIATEWEATRRRVSLPDYELLVVEVRRLLRVFHHAAQSGECVVSALDCPADEARARRVRLLWAAR